MTEANTAHIAVVLDRSGSMSARKADTIEGVNKFLTEQGRVPGDATLTLAQFDDQYELVYENTALADVPLLTNTTFQPRGCTALLDAIGQTIDSTGEYLKGLADSSRPAQVFFVIVTDGLENASTKFRKERVNEMISHQRDKYGWQFVFLGADQDAIASAAGMGIAASNALAFRSSRVGTQNTYASLGTAVSMSRLTGKSVAFTDADRAAAAAED